MRTYQDKPNGKSYLKEKEKANEKKKKEKENGDLIWHISDATIRSFIREKDLVEGLDTLPELKPNQNYYV